jgi:hypothetical protein
MTLAEDSRSILEQMLDVAENNTNEPGTLSVDQVLHAGDEILPAPMAVQEVSSAGWTNVWDTLTGERSHTNNNMLATQLSKKREDGTRVFTTAKPDIEPLRGDLKCYLHPEASGREEWNRYGFAECPKSNLRNEHERTTHMAHRHKSEWAEIEGGKDRDERTEDRDLQRGAMAAQNALVEVLAKAMGVDVTSELAAAVAEGIAPVETTVVEEAPAKRKRAPNKKQQTVECSWCHAVFEAATVLAARAKLRAHERVAHGSEA